MEQKKLEERVREIFEQQGFEVESEGNEITAKKNDEMYLKIFSSEEFSEEEVVENSGEEKVFVDEGLSDLQDELENQVSIIREDENEEYNLPSYELIGEIAVINELTVEEGEAVEGILKHHPSVKTILLKEEPLQGEYRVGEYRKLYGEETETVHKEFGCRFKVDPTVAFFSEREGTERKRILDRVEEEERILVMFCGVGPYPVFLASKKDVGVVGVEKNPEAVKFAKENVELNGVEESVEIIEGDVAEEVPKLGSFDRILMPSPTNAEQFLDEAFEASKTGTKLTFYGISRKENLFEDYINEIKLSADRNNFKANIDSKRVVSDYSPSQKKIAVDLSLQ
jgi:tRNA (guanine37-N1)-methyltransferase